jgi:hypothetical protein
MKLLHACASLRLESAQTEVLTLWVIRDKSMERLAPSNLLTSGGKNLSERSRFFIVQRHALTGLSKQA